jgi:hypothetical protein
MKIRPVGAELFHVDGQRQKDMMKIIVAFRNFVNAPKRRFINEILVSTHVISFHAISIRRHTQLHISLPALKASQEVIS